MPKSVKSDTIRLLESSVEALGLAQTGICTFRKDQPKIKSVRYSAEIGLIGASVELSMSAILFEALGKKALFRGEKYKTASEVLSDFRKLLNQSSPNIKFLVKNIDKPEEHIKKLISLTDRFKVIIIGRANGLHFGQGLSYEVTTSLFQDASSFLKKLSKSKNLQPYLPTIPELVGIKLDKTVVVSELYNRFNNSTDKNEQTRLLSSLFLILPEVPNHLPSWFERFSSVNIAPKKSDIVYLIDALEKANPVSLKRVKDGSGIINVNISKDPNALPIAPHYLRASFTQFKDQVLSDIGSANGRFTENHLDLPPTETVYKLFSIFPNQVSVLFGKEDLTAHEAWPFILKAIRVPSNNTTGPLWFLIRKTNDLGQLISILKKASTLGNQTLINNTDSIISGIDAILNDKTIDTSINYYATINSDIELLSSNLDKLRSFPNGKIKHLLPEEYAPFLQSLFKQESDQLELIRKILDDKELSLETRKYWLFKLTSILPWNEDIELLSETMIQILNQKELASCHTWVRKMFRVIDFNNYGPKVV